ncbi:hypothetical protein [Candidatus Chrysopegis kryptomonas]|uniref:Uncharacterized protein n=1 Tax=Candidatus Chryseopegocella kryptomonas TaxID=1633643 RepID=A0A0P1MNF1_9BACT|nr:hypothetical protein [Candidatus Chrysopegis kryptomonas]CUS97028.1 hypothetical protein JGI23_00225 [Candidatus Chrysopegis kryptomonas]
MKLKIVVGSILIAGFIIFGAYSFMESNVKYVTIEEAKKNDEESPDRRRMGQRKRKLLRRKNKSICLLS